MSKLMTSAPYLASCSVHAVSCKTDDIYLRVYLQAGVQRRRVLEDEGVELVVEVQLAVVAARLAALRDRVALRRHDQLRLRVVALRAQHELADEPAPQYMLHMYLPLPAPYIHR